MRISEIIATYEKNEISNIVIMIFEKVLISEKISEIIEVIEGRDKTVKP